MSPISFHRQQTGIVPLRMCGVNPKSAPLPAGVLSQLRRPLPRSASSLSVIAEIGRREGVAP